MAAKRFALEQALAQSDLEDDALAREAAYGRHGSVPGAERPTFLYLDRTGRYGHDRAYGAASAPGASRRRGTSRSLPDYASSPTGNEVLFEGSYGFSGDMVSKGWQRAAHRQLDPELSTPEQPVHTHRLAEPLEPGEIVPVTFAMRPHATRLRKGDQLRLDIQGHWFYRKSKFGGQFPAAYRKSSDTVCILHSGGSSPSLSIRRL